MHRLSKDCNSKLVSFSEILASYYPALILFHIHYPPVRGNQKVSSEAQEKKQNKTKHNI